MRIFLFAIALLGGLPVWAETVLDTKSQSADYMLGPDDVIELLVADSEEFADRSFRIDGSGEIVLPLIGTVSVAGKTLKQVEHDIKESLKRYVKTPDVVVTVKDFHSQPVSVIGAVKTPGVHQLRGRRTLADVLATAGGLTDDAGRVVRITRRLQCPGSSLPAAPSDGGGSYQAAEVSLKEVLGADPVAQSIVICPHDTIAVPRAEIVYVVGQVVRAGGFPLNERSNITVLQAIALAGGLSSMASPKNARILRAGKPDTDRTEIPVNLAKVMEGKAPDVLLQPEDMLFVPNNVSKRAGVRAAEAALQTLTGVVIWRSGR
jgi:polysaccharide export outer membrane protein